MILTLFETHSCSHHVDKVTSELRARQTIEKEVTGIVEYADGVCEKGQLYVLCGVGHVRVVIQIDVVVGLGQVHQGGESRDGDKHDGETTVLFVHGAVVLGSHLGAPGRHLQESTYQQDVEDGDYGAGQDEAYAIVNDHGEGDVGVLHPGTTSVKLCNVMHHVRSVTLQPKKTDCSDN